MSIHFLKMSRILPSANSVSTRSSWSLGCTSGAKVSVVGLLIAMAISVEAADRVLLTGLCTSLCWRLHPPEHEGGWEGETAEDREKKCSQETSSGCFFFVLFSFKAWSMHVCNLAGFCAGHTALLWVFYLMKLRWLKPFPLGGLYTRPLCGVMNELARFGGMNKSRNHKPLLDKSPYFNQVRHASDPLRRDNT